VLFSLLLFQFGNEWAIAVRLPIFLTHRLGTTPRRRSRCSPCIGSRSPSAASARKHSARVRYPAAADRVLTSMFGCLVLVATDTFGAVTGILLGVFAPTMWWRKNRRPPYHHPGFRRLFSFAIAGGLPRPVRSAWPFPECAR
jgi:hypothetical protein